MLSSVRWQDRLQAFCFFLQLCSVSPKVKTHVLRGTQLLTRHSPLWTTTEVEMVEMVVTEWQVPLEPLAGMGRGETVDPRDLLAHPLEDWSTLAGGGPPAPPPQELNSSMTELQPGASLLTRVEEQRFSACLTFQSMRATYAPGVQGKSYIYGVELHPHGGPFASVRQQNMPCAVCSGTKTRVLMIPARVSCPPQWQREYSGYLMAPHSTSNYRNSFMCVDKHPEVVPGQEGDTDGSNDPHHVEATCEGLPCPPYNPEKELTCVICTM